MNNAILILIAAIFGVLMGTNGCGRAQAFDTSSCQAYEIEGPVNMVCFVTYCGSQPVGSNCLWQR
jgi:hypothetical protein